MNPVLIGTPRSTPTTTGRRWNRGNWEFVSLLAVVLVVILGGSLGAQQQPDLVVIANEDVPVTALSEDELASRATRSWKDGNTVRPLNLPAGTSERSEFDRVVLKMSPERSAQFWIERQVRGEEPAPKAIAKADIIVQLVATLRGSFGSGHPI